MSDEQDRAEALDEDVVDAVDDRTGDEYGEALPDYPPDRPVGVGMVGVTANEQAGGESMAERASREEAEVAADDTPAAPASGDVGQLVELDASTLDDEPQLVGETQPGTALTAEEAAMHIEPEP